MKKKRRNIYILYAIAAILLVMIPFAITFTRTGTSVGVLGDDYVDISNEWRMEPSEDCEPLVNGTYGENMDEKIGVINLYYKIPEDFRDSHLVYRSKDVYTKVFIDDELLYETEVYQSELYNESPGNIWNAVRINSYDAGKWVRLEVSVAYDVNAVVVDHIMLGDKSDILVSYIQSKTYDIILSIVIIIIGVSLFVLNLYTYVGKSVSKVGTTTLSLYAITIGIWCLCETNVLQLIVDDVRMIQLLDNLVMFTATLLMVFFIDSYYDILKSRFIRLFCYLDILLLGYCFVVQVTGISDFHDSIFMAWIAFFIAGPILIISCIRGIYRKIKSKDIQVANVLHVVGFALLTLAGLFEGIRYAGIDSADRAQMLRLGLLLFIICFALGNQMDNYKIIKQGVKYNIVKNLAYSDGLTGLGNRTSYLEKISEYEKGEVNDVGIVFLDLNNLKKVNDTYGHEMGDEYVITAADIIKKSFGRYGESYRIGGDEFCVFMETRFMSDRYLEARDCFDKLLFQANKIKKCEVPVEIACGFAIYDRSKDRSFSDKIQEADELMYQDKAELKKKRNEEIR